MQEVFRRVGWKLMNLRQERNLTQTALGEKIGLSKYQVSRFEKGFGDTTLRNIYLACNFFEISLEELFHKEEKVRIDIALREEITEKHSQGLHIKNFAKALDKNLVKIRILDLPPLKVKNIRIDPTKCYEMLALEGHPTVESYNDKITMKVEQIVAVCGDGYARLLNYRQEPARILIFAY